MKHDDEYAADDLPDEAEIVTSDTSATAALDLLAKGWLVYTQVDCPDGDVTYIKGWHRVNQTGVYALLPPE